MVRSVHWNALNCEEIVFGFKVTQWTHKTLSQYLSLNYPAQGSLSLLSLSLWFYLTHMLIGIFKYIQNTFWQKGHAILKK